VRGLAATWAVVAAVAVPMAFAAGPALKQENIPTHGVALKVPSSWLGLDPSKLSVKVAFAVADPKTTAGFHANLNLLVSAVPAVTPTRKWLLGASTARYLAIGRLKSLEINGETALEYESSKLEASGGVPLYTLEFAFNHDGKAYLFTYTAPAGAKERFKPTFMASARTITFVAAPPGSA